MKIAGLGEFAVLCELTNEDGTMPKLPEICRFAKKHDMSVVSIEDIYQYRKEKFINNRKILIRSIYDQVVG